MMKRILLISLLTFALSACLEEDKTPILLEVVSNTNPNDVNFSLNSVDPLHFPEEYFIDASITPAELVIRSTNAYALSILPYDAPETKNYTNDECAFSATVVDRATIKIHFSPLKITDESVYYLHNFFYVVGMTSHGKERVPISITRYPLD